jgi:hypothetical protein
MPGIGLLFLKLLGCSKAGVTGCRIPKEEMFQVYKEVLHLSTRPEADQRHFIYQAILANLSSITDVEYSIREVLPDGPVPDWFAKLLGIMTGPPGSENEEFMAAARNLLETRGFLDPSEVQTCLNENDVPVDPEPPAEDISPSKSEQHLTALFDHLPPPNPDLGHLPIARTIIDLRSYRFVDYTSDFVQFWRCSSKVTYDQIAVLMIPGEVEGEPEVSFRKLVVRFFNDIDLAH